MEKCYNFFLKGILSASILSSFLFSCDKAQSVSMLNTLMPEKHSFEKRISKDKIEISAEDAAIAATMFVSGNGSVTKEPTSREIKNIVTIKDVNGEPAIYAVNFENGYVWVSATKCYYPILAEVECGTFSNEKLSTGEDVILSELIDNIINLRKYSDAEIKKLWSRFEEPMVPQIVRTKLVEDDLYDKQYELIENLRAQGYNVYLLKNKPESLPENMYQSYCMVAEGLNPWGDELNPLETAVIAEKSVYRNTGRGPLIKTTWGQKRAFNSALSDPDMPLGCVTIAVAQIMKYFEYPSEYDWARMPDTTSSVVLSDFLAQLRKDLWTTSSGGSNYINAKRVLTANGYYCEVNNHSVTDVTSSLIDGRPVYMRGKDSAQGEGHAWICDGDRLADVFDEYKLFILNDQYYPKFEYQQVECNLLNHRSYPPMYHMNWGWYGTYDGWYADGRIENPNGNFNSDRKDIIITGWK